MTRHFEKNISIEAPNEVDFYDNSSRNFEKNTAIEIICREIENASVSRNFEGKPNNTNSNSVVEPNFFHGTSTVTISLLHNPNCSTIQQDMTPENAPNYHNSDN